VGRNYAPHRVEMGGSDRDEPFFFQKPRDALVSDPRHIPYPKGTSQLSYEVELVVLMGKDKSVHGYTVGVDLTKRDVQNEAKQKGRPWESAKSFDNSAIIGQISTNSLPEDVRIQLLVNNELKQSSCISEMIWKIPQLVEKLEIQDFSVCEGDLIYTGTPAGVGLLRRGDICVAKLLNLDGTDIVPQLKFTVV